MRIIIAGGRDFDDYDYLQDKVSNFILMELPEDMWKHVEIVSGGARGSDLLGERYAKERGLTIKQFIPDWQKPDGTTDRGAGHRRNREMAKYADILLAFWDEKSPGTKSMIDFAIKEGLWVEVFTY